MSPLVADLSTEAGTASVDAALGDPRLTTVIDNAALAHYKPFVELPQAELTELVMLNALAPARLLRAALPATVERGRGTVVSVATLLVFSGARRQPDAAAPRRLRGDQVVPVHVGPGVGVGVRRHTGVRLQVVCPGIAKTESHTRQGMDLSGGPRIEPKDVVQASLWGLELGELICIPAWPGRYLLDGAAGAEAGVLTAGMNSNLARHYLP